MFIPDQETLEGLGGQVSSGTRARRIPGFADQLAVRDALSRAGDDQSAEIRAAVAAQRRTPAAVKRITQNKARKRKAAQLRGRVQWQGKLNRWAWQWNNALNRVVWAWVNKLIPPGANKAKASALLKTIAQSTPPKPRAADPKKGLADRLRFLRENTARGWKATQMRRDVRKQLIKLVPPAKRKQAWAMNSQAVQALKAKKPKK